MANHLYYGDNLQVLRTFAPETVDLVYLDPPFNSQANYNVLFKATSGEKSEAQIEAFEDTWHWNASAEQAFDEVMHSGNTSVSETLRALRTFMNESDMLAYLTMMAVRLLELHRVLKPTGSLYLHCDSTASHYLKILLDGVFGPGNFRNDIVWKRQSAHSDAKLKFPAVSDCLLFYSKSAATEFHPQYADHDPAYLDAFYKYDDNDGRGIYRLSDMAAPKGGGMAAINKNTGLPNGWYVWKGYEPPQTGWRYSQESMQQLHDEKRINYPLNDDGTPAFKKRISLKRYFAEQKGSIVTNVWTDIPSLTAAAAEAMGYPTQKPVALLERIIEASSVEGDLILDPFCGCGTTIHAAEKLKRRWIGIDITHLAISLIEKRLKDAFPTIEFELHGTPKDLDGATALAAYDKYQFQWWAVSLVDAVPFAGKKKGADGGIDGFIYFKPDGKNTERAVVSVKGGANIGIAMVRELIQVVDATQAKIGVMITLVEPSAPMIKEAVKAGYYETQYGKYPKLQIFTVNELFHGKLPNIPLIDPTAFKKAKVENTSKQGKLI